MPPPPQSQTLCKHHSGQAFCLHTIRDSFRTVVKTTADRPSVYTIPDSLRIAVNTAIADRLSVYTIPDSLCAVVKTKADKLSVYTIPDSLCAVVKARRTGFLFTLYQIAFVPL